MDRLGRDGQIFSRLCISLEFGLIIKLCFLEIFLEFLYLEIGDRSRLRICRTCEITTSLIQLSGYISLCRLIS